MKKDKTKVDDSQFASMDQVPIGIFVLRRDFVVVFWNTCLEDWTGISRDRMLGESVSLCLPHLEKPKYKERIKSIFSGYYIQKILFL